MKLSDVVLSVLTVTSLFWLGKTMDKKLYKLVGKKHRYDYK